MANEIMEGPSNVVPRQVACWGANGNGINVEFPRAFTTRLCKCQSLLVLIHLTYTLSSLFVLPQSSLKTLCGCLQATFKTQANALLRKNAVFQLRNRRSNCCLTVTPVLFIMLLFVIQKIANSAFDNESNRVNTYPAVLCVFLEKS